MPSLNAHAKINLLLNVLGRRANGYHDLEMVNVSIDLADAVTIEPADELTIVMQGSALPTDNRNIAYRAAETICRARGIEPRFRITIRKEIPIGAGLAGGSTDAAAVLKLLGADRTDRAALAELGLSLGADVPYCLFGAPAIVRGIGEIIEPISVKNPLHLVLANPGFEVSTRDIFERFDAGSGKVPPPGSSPLVLKKNPRRASLSHLAGALAAGDLTAIAEEISNDLEDVTTKIHPQIGELITDMKSAGAAKAFMTGSGPTVVGLFDGEAHARAACEKLKSRAIFAGMSGSMVRTCRTIAS